MANLRARFAELRGGQRPWHATFPTPAGSFPGRSADSVETALAHLLPALPRWITGAEPGHCPRGCWRLRALPAGKGHSATERCSSSAPALHVSDSKRVTFLDYYSFFSPSTHVAVSL